MMELFRLIKIYAWVEADDDWCSEKMMSSYNKGYN